MSNLSNLQAGDRRTVGGCLVVIAGFGILGGGLLVPEYRDWIKAAGLIVVSLGFFSLSVRADTQARKDWEILAKARRLTFHPGGEGLPDLEPSLKGTVAELGPLANVHTALAGAVADTRFILAEVDDRTGKGSRHWTALVALRNGWNLPDMTVEREGEFHRLGELLLGLEDLDFGEDPVFSSAYVVKGRPEHLVRRVMDPQVLLRIRRLGNVSIRAGRSTVVVIPRDRGRLAPQELEEFLSKGLAFVQALVS